MEWKKIIDRILTNLWCFVDCSLEGIVERINAQHILIRSNVGLANEQEVSQNGLFCLDTKSGNDFLGWNIHDLGASRR